MPSGLLPVYLSAKRVYAPPGAVSSQSCAYITHACASWRTLEAQVVLRAASRARKKTGNSNATSTARMAMTTRISIKVKPLRCIGKTSSQS